MKAMQLVLDIEETGPHKLRVSKVPSARVSGAFKHFTTEGLTPVARQRYEFVPLFISRDHSSSTHLYHFFLENRSINFSGINVDMFLYLHRRLFVTCKIQD